MHKLWLIAKNEYRKMVSKRSFILSTLGIPLLIVVVMSLTIFIALNSEDDKPIGIIDQAQVTDPAVAKEFEVSSDFVPVVLYSQESDAQKALENGEIQAYYLIPIGYPDSATISVFYWENSPSSMATATFDSYIRQGLTSGLSSEARQRIVSGADVTFQSSDGLREVGSHNFINFVLPFASGFFFVLTVMTSAGYMLQVVTDEKENRTIEMMITSVSPNQLIAGKAVGLIAVALTQILIWSATLVIGLIIAARFIPSLQQINLPWQFLGIMSAFFLPAFALSAGFMTIIGGAVNEVKHGQQIAGILNLLFMVPYFLTVLILTDPNGPIMVAMTLFPTTAFVAISLRWAMSTIPAWQLILSWLILTGSSIFSLWASAKVFRVGMLRYGQTLRLSSVLAAIRSKPVAYNEQ